MILRYLLAALPRSSCVVLCKLDELDECFGNSLLRKVLSQNGSYYKQLVSLKNGIMCESLFLVHQYGSFFCKINLNINFWLNPNVMPRSANGNGDVTQYYMVSWFFSDIMFYFSVHNIYVVGFSGRFDNLLRKG